MGYLFKTSYLYICFIIIIIIIINCKLLPNSDKSLVISENKNLNTWAIFLFVSMCKLYFHQLFCILRFPKFYKASILKQGKENVTCILAQTLCLNYIVNCQEAAQIHV